MLKISLSLIALYFLFPIQTAIAADPLNNTRWQTFDDETGQPKGIIELTEKNGLIFGNIVKTLTGNPNACNTCQGKYAGKPLIGATIIRNLQPKGKGEYADGTIDDPKKGKTYKLKVTLKGNELDVRGFVGISLLGRTQTWKKMP